MLKALRSGVEGGRELVGAMEGVHAEVGARWSGLESGGTTMHAVFKGIARNRLEWSVWGC